jgi:prepilin-type N-terminal cleavage/methylation domain-containing protein
MTAGRRCHAAFTLMEAMVVLAIFAIVATVAAMTHVSILKSVRSSKQTLSLYDRARVTTDLLLAEIRDSGGPDLGPHGHIVVAKGAGQRGTDVFWTLRQNTDYAVCAVESAQGDELRFQRFDVNGQRVCCFEAGPALPGTTTLHGEVPGGRAFRRTAVLVDARQRVLPVFLTGDGGAECTLQMVHLPGVLDAVPAERRPHPRHSIAVLADVKRHYIDFDPSLEAAQPAVGILFSQVELDGDVQSFRHERLRIAHGVADLRLGFGYLDGRLRESRGSGDSDIPALADSDIVEREEASRGWRSSPAVGPSPDVIGVAVQVGVAGTGGPSPLPWSTTAPAGRGLRAASMVGRVALRKAEGP